MTRCFGYIRVSTQRQGEGVSLEAQRDAIEAFASSHDIEIVRWYEERITAAKSGRPVFNAMVRALHRREADGLVVHKIDRSARNFADWARIGDLADRGLTIHFASESLDFSSRGGRLTADIQAVIAADYIRNLREESLKGLRGRLKQGLYPWRAPLGYVDRGGGQVKTLDPDRAPLIKQLFELYASGEFTIRSLRSEAARRGLTNRHTGRPLTLNGIERILRNPFFCGVIKIKGETYPGIHEPLISPATFADVQRIKRGRAGPKIHKRSYALQGLFRCTHCRRAMTPELHKDTVYYRCHTSRCPTKGLREDQLQSAIAAFLEGVQLDDDTDASVERLLVGLAEIQATARFAIKATLTQVEARIGRLADAILDARIDPETAREKQASLLMERAQLRGRLEGGAHAGTELQIAANVFRHVARVYELANESERRQLLRLVSSKREVDGKNPTIEPDNWLGCFRNSLAVTLSGAHRNSKRMPGEYTKHPYHPVRNQYAFSEKHLQAVLRELRPEKLEQLSAIVEKYANVDQRLRPEIVPRAAH